MEFFEYTYNLFRLYADKGILILLYVIAWIIVFCLEKKKENRIVFVYTAWYLPLVLLNPLFGMLLDHFNVLATRISRLYWLLPIFFMIAYGCSVLTDWAEKKKREYGFFVAVILCLLLVLSGKPVIDDPGTRLTENKYKLPQSVVDVVDMINENAGVSIDMDFKTLDEAKRVTVLPVELAEYARIYDPTLQLLYGRYAEIQDIDLIAVEMATEKQNVGGIVEHAKEYQCKYICFNMEHNLTNWPEDGILTKIGESGKYCLYSIN